jgi:hypothetical protein
MSRLGVAWLCVITLTVLYVGAYFSIVVVEHETVVVQGREIFFAPAYQAADGLSEWVFLPVHVIDRNLRRGEWHARILGESTYKMLLVDFGLVGSGKP